MAIYQFYLGIVPKDGVLKIHHEIPEKIVVNTETGYFESEMNRYWNATNVELTKMVE